MCTRSEANTFASTIRKTIRRASIPAPGRERTCCRNDSQYRPGSRVSNATAIGVFTAVSLVVIVAAVLIVRAYLRR